MKKIFVSYSHKDRDFVTRLISDLKEVGVDVWVDEAEIKLGDSLISKTQSAIDNVEYVIAVLSRNSINFPLANKELDVAMNYEIEGKRLKVIPVIIDDVQPPGFLIGKMHGYFKREIEYSNEL